MMPGVVSTTCLSQVGMAHAGSITRGAMEIGKNILEAYRPMYMALRDIVSGLSLSLVVKRRFVAWKPRGRTPFLQQL